MSIISLDVPSATGFVIWTSKTSKRACGKWQATGFASHSVTGLSWQASERSPFAGTAGLMGALADLGPFMDNALVDYLNYMP
jgi:hypothetical protein